MPLILLNGAEWFAALGPEKNGGPKLYCVSGHVKRPGVYEASMHVTLRELIEGHAGGVREGRTLKAVIPGGSSVPFLMPDQLDTQASFDGVQKAGSLLGLGRHRSCSTTRPAWSGWRRTSCTSTVTSRAASARRAAKAPTGSTRSSARSSAARARCAISICCRASPRNIAGKTLCAFGDAAVTPVLTTLKHFRHEYEAHIKEGRCTLPADWRARQPVGAH